MTSEKQKRIERLERAHGVTGNAVVIYVATRVRRLDPDLVSGLYVQRVAGTVQRVRSEEECAAAMSAGKPDEGVLKRLVELGIQNGGRVKTFCLACGHGYRYVLAHLRFRPDCAAETVRKLGAVA